MNPALLIPIVLKGLTALNTRKHYEAKTGKPRPAILSRRAIGTGMVAVSGLIAAFTGVQIPEGQLTSVVDLGYQAIELVKQNKELGLTIWGSVVTIIGHFKRKK